MPAALASAGTPRAAVDLRRSWSRAGLPVALAASLAGCVEKTDAEYRADLVVSIHDSIGNDLALLTEAVGRLQAAAPHRRWDAKTFADHDAQIAEMRMRWKELRTAYERIEGAVVALFPGEEARLDGRYEELLAAIDDDAGDSDPFDDRGVTGMHAIERILFAPEIRPEVIAFESTLPGYRPAAYPATDGEAISFKTVLVQDLVDHARSLEKRWQPAAIDIGEAYRGLIGLMHEQREKINLAVTGEEESRYANVTMFDLRCNLEGTQKVHDLFRAWIRSKSSGPDSDSALRGKFGELATVYAASDALPDAPADWRPEAPTQANLATPFGAVWKTVHESTDPHDQRSVVYSMNQIAAMLGLPAFDAASP